MGTYRPQPRRRLRLTLRLTLRLRLKPELRYTSKRTDLLLQCKLVVPYPNPIIRNFLESQSLAHNLRS